ncbi:MAG TPA: ATP-dependent 6-phosphofructokinase [Rectinemataceae bacterium]|nr:ATP-dependent 6-phosphofructokinase [Rectinemataceae bacterium]
MAIPKEFQVRSLGEARITSPLALSRTVGDALADYEDDRYFVRHEVEVEADGVMPEGPVFERAGPRRMIYFNPSHVHAGIVTCGGLCPGLNDVIRATVRCLWYRYGVRRITGIRYGYRGFLPDSNLEVLPLGPEIVDEIHKAGGTILGSSRGGGERTSEIVDAIERLNLTMLFTIGGDGTQKGALAIAEEIERRHLKVSIIGIPKTIDNDLLWLDRSFGFETAVARASDAVACAHAEADSYINGIGLVKLMGRDSGFIAVHTALAAHAANFVLIPEVPFDLEGPAGFLTRLEERIAARHHAVIIVAEGAGQEHLAAVNAADASGNKLHADIGLYLKERIEARFREKGIEIGLKYIDPSYMVRSAPASPVDSVYCERLGGNAVHAAMAGKTGMIVGMVNSKFVHIPIEVATKSRSKVDPEDSLWRDAVESTHQPFSMRNGA